MGVHLRRPTRKQLSVLLERSRSDRLTYEPVGGSLNGPTPSGLQRHSWTTPLSGPDAFFRGVEALHTWAVHRDAGLEVVADGPIEVGTNVAMSAPLPVGFVDISCRITAIVDERDRFGFAYGTLSVHPERGEESFVMIRDHGDSARFEVQAVSHPRHPVARVLPVLGNRLQDAAVRRYLDAMRRITTR